MLGRVINGRCLLLGEHRCRGDEMALDQRQIASQQDCREEGWVWSKWYVFLGKRVEILRSSKSP
jgi:hypothetical protein